MLDVYLELNEAKRLSVNMLYRLAETMSDMGLRSSKMLVKDVMSSPVVTIEPETPINKAAELMDKHGLGCIIVQSKEGKPLGIITERDLVARVLAKNVKPDRVKSKGSYDFTFNHDRTRKKP